MIGSTYFSISARSLAVRLVSSGRLPFRRSQATAL
jgi:hypothetical protein